MPGRVVAWPDFGLPAELAWQHDRISDAFLEHVEAS
jgi:hypothetical protein